MYLRFFASTQCDSGDNGYIRDFVAANETVSADPPTYSYTPQGHDKSSATRQNVSQSSPVPSNQINVRSDLLHPATSYKSGGETNANHGKTVTSPIPATQQASGGGTQQRKKSGGGRQQPQAAGGAVALHRLARDGDLAISLYDSALPPGDGNFTSGCWDSLNGYGSWYSVSDVDGRKLLMQGSLCSYGEAGKPDFCDVSTLGRGQYLWRVTGALSKRRSDIAWEFCGVQGGATTQLKFEIDAQGHCNPLDVKVALAGSWQDSQLTSSSVVLRLEGSLLLVGLQTTELEAPLLRILERVISEELLAASIADVSAEDAQTRSMAEVSVVSYHSDDYLGNLLTHKVVFRASVQESLFDWGEDTRSAGSGGMQEQSIAAALQHYLQQSIQSGMFAAEVIALAAEGNLNGASQLTISQGQSGLQLRDVTNEDLSSTLEKSSIRTLSISATNLAVVCIAALIGVTAGIAMQTIFKAQKTSKVPSATIPAPPMTPAARLTAQMTTQRWMPRSEHSPDFARDESYHAQSKAIPVSLALSTIHESLEMPEFEGRGSVTL